MFPVVLYYSGQVFGVPGQLEFALIQSELQLFPVSSSMIMIQSPTFLQSDSTGKSEGFKESKPEPTSER